MRELRQTPAETEATVVRICTQIPGLRAKLESDLMNKKAGAATVRGRRTADNGRPTQEPKNTFSL